MDKDIFFRNRKKILLYTNTITCFIISILFRKDIVVIYSSEVSTLIAYVFLIASYVMFMTIAFKLTNKGIYGLPAIGLASFVLQTNVAFRSFSIMKWWWHIVLAILVFYYVSTLVYGLIHLAISLVYVVKKQLTSDDKTADSIDIVVAVVTSIIALVLSIIELLIN